MELYDDHESIVQMAENIRSVRANLFPKICRITAAAPTAIKE